MSGATAAQGLVNRDAEDLISTAIAGLGGGVGLGVVLYTLDLLGSVGHLVDRPGLGAGIPVLLLAGVLGAVVYRAIGTRTMPEEDVTDPITGVTLGACFGLLAWVIGVAILLPLWLRLLGRTPPFPFLHWESLVGLVVYGLVVGPLLPIADRWLRP